jgi:hypothetical protein
LQWSLTLPKDHFGHPGAEAAMMIDLGESQIFKWQVAQTFDGIVRSDFSLAHLIEKFADGFGVHGQSVAKGRWRVV